MKLVFRHEQEDKPQGMGSRINSAKNRVGRMTDSNVASLPRVLPGSSKKTVGHRRLPSIAQDQLRLKTPNVYSDEVLRGTKLYDFISVLSYCIDHVEFR